MSKEMICGYVVVDKRKEGETYRGFDREPWETVEVDFYDGKLPGRLSELYRELSSARVPDFWQPDVFTLEVAVELLHYSREAGREVELIGVWSPDLQKKRGSAPDESSRLLGLEVGLPSACRLCRTAAINSLHSREPSRGVLDAFQP